MEIQSIDECIEFKISFSYEHIFAHKYHGQLMA